MKIKLCFSHRFRPLEVHLTLSRWDILLVIYVKYLGVIFCKRITRRLNIEMIEVKVFRTFIRVYSLHRSERLNSNFKLTLHEALISSVMIYAYPAWKLVSDTYQLKLQRLKNKIICTTGKFPKCRPVPELHMTFQVPYTR
jgi:hypothetical protein